MRPGVFFINLLCASLWAAPAHLQLRTPIGLPFPQPSGARPASPIKTKAKDRPGRRMAMLEILDRQSGNAPYGRLYQYRFRLEANRKEASIVNSFPLTSVQTNAPPIFVAHYCDGYYAGQFFEPGFYLFRAGRENVSEKPVWFGESISGKELGLGEGTWTFQSPTTGKLRRL